MNKTELLIDRIKKFENKEQRNLAWSLLDEKTKKIIKKIINKIGIKLV